MKVIKGRFVEVRAYMSYVRALFRPGSEVPVFEEPQDCPPEVADWPDSAVPSLLDEARRQLDRQHAEIQRNHTRASAVVTFTVAELAFLALSRSLLFEAGPAAASLWFVALILAGLALAGAVSVLISRAEYGKVDVYALARRTDVSTREIAKETFGALGRGDVTNAARLTVLRDAAFLAMLSGVVLLLLAATAGQPT